MNRHERRAAKAKRSSFRDQILSWPEVTAGSIYRPGQVVHTMVLHDDWCRTLNGGTGADCNCEPRVSYRLQPNDLDEPSPKRGAVMNRPEQTIQRAIFQHFRLRAAPGVVAWHTPNGGWRRPIEAKILKAQGVRPGIPDVCAIKDGRAYFLELKAKGGRLTEAQEKMLIDLRAAGAMATHADGLDQALRVLEGWGLLRGQAT